jgi:hypothetical protein
MLNLTRVAIFLTGTSELSITAVGGNYEAASIGFTQDPTKTPLLWSYFYLSGSSAATV